MKFGLEIKEEAKFHIEEAFIYYNKINENLGLRFLDTLEKYFIKIQNNPFLFQTKYTNIREAYIRDFPYLIIYEIIENKIIVYAIFLAYKSPKKKPKFL